MWRRMNILVTKILTLDQIVGSPILDDVDLVLESLPSSLGL